MYKDIVVNLESLTEKKSVQAPAEGWQHFRLDSLGQELGDPVPARPYNRLTAVPPGQHYATWGATQQDVQRQKV